MRAQGDHQRSECLRQLREQLTELAGGEDRGISQDHVVRFLAKKEVSTSFFKLFDHEFNESLDQSSWLEMLRTNLAK